MRKWPEYVKDSKVMWEMIDTELSDKHIVSKAVIHRRITNDNIRNSYTKYFKE